MLNFTKTESSLVEKTAQQFDTKLMHPSEKFRQNLLVKFQFKRGFDFLIHELKTEKMFSLACRWKDMNLQPPDYKPSALAIELYSSKAGTGKELSLVRGLWKCKTN